MIRHFTKSYDRIWSRKCILKTSNIPENITAAIFLERLIKSNLASAGTWLWLNERFTPPYREILIYSASQIETTTGLISRLVCGSDVRLKISSSSGFLQNFAVFCQPPPQSNSLSPTLLPKESVFPLPHIFNLPCSPKSTLPVGLQSDRIRYQRIIIRSSHFPITR